MATAPASGPIPFDLKPEQERTTNQTFKCIANSLEYKSSYDDAHLGLDEDLKRWPTIRQLPVQALPTLHINNYMTPREIDEINHLSSAFMAEEIEITISDLQFFQDKQAQSGGTVVTETMATTQKLKMNVYFDMLGLFDGQAGMYVFNPLGSVVYNGNLEYDVNQSWPDGAAKRAKIWTANKVSEGLQATKPLGYDIGMLSNEWGIRSEFDIPWGEMAVGDSKTFTWKIADPKWRPTRPKAEVMGSSVYHTNPGFFSFENCPIENNHLINKADQLTYPDGWKLLKKPRMFWSHPVRMGYPQFFQNSTTGQFHLMKELWPQTPNGARSDLFKGDVTDLVQHATEHVDTHGTYIGFPVNSSDVTPGTTSDMMKIFPEYSAVGTREHVYRRIIRNQQFTHDLVNDEPGSEPIWGPKMPDTLLMGFMYRSPTWAAANIRQNVADDFKDENPVANFGYKRQYDCFQDFKPFAGGVEACDARRSTDDKGCYCDSEWWEWLQYNPEKSTFNERDIPTLLVQVPRIYNAQNNLIHYNCTFNVTYKLKFKVKGGTASKLYFPRDPNNVTDLQHYGSVDTVKMMAPDKFIAMRNVQGGLIKACKPWGWTMDGYGLATGGQQFLGLPNEND